MALALVVFGAYDSYPSVLFTMPDFRTPTIFLTQHGTINERVFEIQNVLRISSTIQSRDTRSTIGHRNTLSEVRLIKGVCRGGALGGACKERYCETLVGPGLGNESEDAWGRS